MPLVHKNRAAKEQRIRDYNISYFLLIFDIRIRLDFEARRQEDLRRLAGLATLRRTGQHRLVRSDLVSGRREFGARRPTGPGCKKKFRPAQGLRGLTACLAMGLGVTSRCRANN